MRATNNASLRFTDQKLQNGIRYVPVGIDFFHNFFVKVNDVLVGTKDICKVKY